MADHSELVAEMVALEQIGTQERQKLAKKRRIQQLKKWSQREKEWLAKEKQINRRLATIISEENNGLNLKHFTQYSLSERSPQTKQTHIKTHSTGATDDQIKGNCLYNKNNVHVNGNNNNNNNLDGSKCLSLSLDGLQAKSGSAIHGKVHFDPGVMLLEAAARNDFPEVKRLLMLGVSPSSTNHDGLSALHQCCIEASEPMIDLLLGYGANVDARDVEQWTPLHAACTCGHLNLVKILVENGADLLAVNGDGNMPFDLCEDEETLDYLEMQMVAQGITQDKIDLARASTEMQMITDLEDQISNGCDINSIVNEAGVTPLHVAAANGYSSAVKFLIKHGANVNVCDNDLWQPIHGAACWGNEQHIKIVEMLVESGANINAKTANDETVFELCDNAQLLTRLNELKDELESKRAGIDAERLKRTQSRTNSRILSIRRTSVRDKNQISRREAREEALLRVENSSNNGLADTNQGPPDNSTSPNHELPCDKNQNYRDVKINVLCSTENDDAYIEDQKCLKSSLTNLDTPEGEQGFKLGPGNLNLKISDNNNDSSRLDYSAAQESLLDHNGVVNSKTRDHNGLSDLSSADGKLFNGKTQSELEIRKRDETDCINLGKSVSYINSTNYTLSNLKKQRSDSRTRIASLGNYSSESMRFVDDIDICGRNVLLDPEVSHVSSENDRSSHRQFNNSPDLSIRKFRGEPSEVIGGNDKRRTRGCCIMI